jgi:hypothetical protein
MKLIFTFFLGLLNLSCFGQNRVNLGVRNAHAMTYNSKEHKIYLFGGADHEKVMNDLWYFEKNKWVQVVVNHKPISRTFSQLVYDSKNERLLLFGGNKVLFGDGLNSNTFLNDTWEFKKGEWKKIETDRSPQPRAESAMVYDEARNRVVLFGGYTFQDNEFKKLDDTWEFYDNDWHLNSNNGPSARNGASMIFDNNKNKCILFGGSTVDRLYGENKGETWEWNGEKWSQLKMSKSVGVFNASMTYNSYRKEIIRFGGWDGKSRVNGTWLFGANKWNKLDTENGPSSRNHSSMVYDKENKRTVLFGGHDGENVFGDTWEFKDYKWQEISEVNSLKRIENKH